MVKHQTVSDGTFASATEYMKAHVCSTTGAGIELIMKDEPGGALALLNQAADVAWTDLDLTAYTSATSRIVKLELKINVDTAAVDYALFVRKNGGSDTFYPALYVNSNEAHAFDIFSREVTLAMDTGQVIEYKLTAVGGQADFYIAVMGYYE